MTLHSPAQQGPMLTLETGGLEGIQPLSVSALDLSYPNQADDLQMHPMRTLPLLWAVARPRLAGCGSRFQQDCPIHQVMQVAESFGARPSTV
jgi:hypothetical protein